MPANLGARRHANVLCAPARLLLRWAAPPVQQVTLQRRLTACVISGLVTAGVWDQLDYLCVPATGDADTALLNWKMPGRKPLVTSGVVTFTVGKGFSGNGVDSFTQFTDMPAGSPGILFSQDNNAFGAWYQTALPAPANSPECGNTYYSFSPFDSSGALMVTRNSSTTNVNTVAALSAGLMTTTRTGSAGYTLWKDAAVLANITRASAVPVSNVLMFGRRNGFTYYSMNIYSLMFIGGGSLNVPGFYSLFREYMRVQGAV